MIREVMLVTAHKRKSIANPRIILARMLIVGRLASSFCASAKAVSSSKTEGGIPFRKASFFREGRMAVSVFSMCRGLK